MESRRVFFRGSCDFFAMRILRVWVTRLNTECVTVYGLFGKYITNLVFALDDSDLRCGYTPEV